MPERAPSPDANLVEFLSARARRASDGRLTLDAGIGLVVAVGSLIWRPSFWHSIACIGLCFAAFGGWGIADRELRERAALSTAAGTRLGLLRVGRAVAASIGAIAAGLLLISLLGIALGTWIS